MIKPDNNLLLAEHRNPGQVQTVASGIIASVDLAIVISLFAQLKNFLLMITWRIFFLNLSSSKN